MYYAPILIPTLNRYEHLKRLIESLQKNSFAKYTELYISLDYPPSQKYQEGYKKIFDYLKDGIEGFKAVHIFYQNENLGAFKNSDFLETVVSNKYDWIIASEDDNEFSPNFLEYIDKGIEKFKYDKNCLGLTGFNIPIKWQTNGNNVIQCYWINYGSAFSLKKQEDFLKRYTYNWFFQKSLDLKSFVKLYKASKLMFNIYLRGLLCRKDNLMFTSQGKLRAIDTVQTLAMILDNKYYIAPVLSLSRNHGYDGSGVNMGCDSRYEKYPIDESVSFDFDIPNSLTMTKKNRKLFGKEYMLYDTKFMNLHIIKNLILFILRRRQLKKRFCE